MDALPWKRKRLLLLCPLLGCALLGFIIAVAAFVRVDKPVGFAEDEEFGAGLVEEGTVVADDQDAAGEVADILLEVLHRLQVQVVGRLVEQQEIRVGEQPADQVQAPLLATREGRNHLALHDGRKPEDFQESARRDDLVLAQPDPLGDVADVFGDGLFQRKFPAFLVVVGEGGVDSDLKLSRIRSGPAHDDVHHRAFARPVRPDQADPVSGKEVIAEILEESGFPIAFGQMLDLEDLLSKPAFLAGEPALRLMPDGVDLSLHFLDARDASLLLGGARLGPVAEPVQLPPQNVLQPRLFFLLVLQAGLLPLQVGCEGAWMVEDGSFVQLENACGHRVQEVTVVGDDKHRLFAIVDPVLQPFDGRDIQMVGRLVKQQEVGLCRHQAGKCRFFQLSPGKLRHRLAVVEDFQLAKQGMIVVFQIPAVQPVQSGGGDRLVVELSAS